MPARTYQRPLLVAVAILGLLVVLVRLVDLEPYSSVSLASLPPDTIRKMAPLDFVRACSGDPNASLPEPLVIPSPVASIPRGMYCLFTLGGLAKVQLWHLNDKGSSSYSSTWTGKLIDELRERARRREPFIYQQTDLWMFDALDQHPVQGQDVGVFGSMTPWYEALMLERGAKSVTTVEYNEIQTDYPGFHTVLAAEYWASSRDGTRPSFDVIVSISSFEHDGLGRYGDPIDPFGDLHAMARLLTVLRPNGRAFIAVPECATADGLVFNAHRIYGPVRLPLLLAGWENLAVFGTPATKLFDVSQPVHVLRPAPARVQSQT